MNAFVGRLEIRWTPGWFGFGLHDELRLLWEIHGHPTQWVFRFGPWQIIRRKPSNNAIANSQSDRASNGKALLR